MQQILLVDDDVALRLGARLLVDSIDGYRVVAEADSAEEAIAQLEQADSIDLVVTDLKMPGLSGLELTGILKREHPKLPVVMMSTFDEGQYAEQALEAGASAYLMKRALATVLEDAIKAADRGEVWLSDAMWTALLPEGLRRCPSFEDPTLAKAFERLAAVPMPPSAYAREAGVSSAVWTRMLHDLVGATGLYSATQLMLLAQWCVNENVA